MEKMPPVEENRIIHIVHTDNEADAATLADLVEARWGTRPNHLHHGPGHRARTSAPAPSP